MKQKGQTFLPALSCVCATALPGKNFFRFCQVLRLHDDARGPQFFDIGQVNANDYGLEVRALTLLVEPRLELCLRNFFPVWQDIFGRCRMGIILKVILPGPLAFVLMLDEGQAMTVHGL